MTKEGWQTIEKGRKIFIKHKTLHLNYPKLLAVMEYYYYYYTIKIIKEHTEMEELAVLIITGVGWGFMEVVKLS